MMRRNRTVEACRRERGFSLVELLVALAVGMIALAAFYSVFVVQSKRFSVEEQINELQQNIRAGMNLMIMDIRLAGYDPTDVGNFYGITVNADQLELKADLDGSGTIAGQEDIIYKFDAANKRITRNIGGGDQPFIENVQAFSFDYLDLDGNAAATSSLVRQMKISITGRTGKSDPNYTPNGGYRTYTLTSYVTPRNLYY
jgi:type IV pilus assembly protein PilW